MKRLKLRIVEISYPLWDEDEKKFTSSVTYFKIQVKYFWFWFNEPKNACFNTFEEAENYIKTHYSVNERVMAYYGSDCEMID